jgi:hypothetical protein
MRRSLLSILSSALPPAAGLTFALHCATRGPFDYAQGRAERTFFSSSRLQIVAFPAGLTSAVSFRQPTFANRAMAAHEWPIVFCVQLWAMA